MDSDGFYDGLARHAAFAEAAEPARFRPVPDDWLVGVADIVGSTAEIAAGRYKTVNMVGAAVISAVMNGLAGRAFPFVFGGDGAGFAVWPGAAPQARAALAAVRRWAEEAFGMQMRAALIPVAEIRAAGLSVSVSRHQAGPGADYAMFGGGGLLWAERQMKAGLHSVPPAPPGVAPDLTGLSCRWSPMPARNGTVLSLVTQPLPEAAPEAFAAAVQQIVALAQTLERGGHPVPVEGPGSGWPPAGTGLEVAAMRRGGHPGRARLKVLFESLVAWILIRTGLRLGGFDARRYARIVGENADFRKLDDGLKMTLDCDPGTHARLEAMLAGFAAEGLLEYGIATQDAAMMTCIVPSAMRDDHMHFVDGASGGYTLAASRMKAAQAPR